ncbi:hypothetical protein Avbf_00318 [Armadillidium vulgare]|nr:hypothetical protein Avbf_00318 [Armadillidium vulgare]
MSSGSSVSSLHSVRWDVSCSSTEEESPLGSPTCSSSPSSCQVSSSSTVLRSSSKKKSNKTQNKNNNFTSSIGEIPSNNEVEYQDSNNRSPHDEPVDSQASTMGLDTFVNYKTRNSNRRVSSPHPDGTVKKSNKPQMERRGDQRIIREC